MSGKAFCLALLLSTAAATPALPQNQAPFEASLMRLSEVLGSLHYLRNLCGGTSDTQWRDYMQRLLEAESPNDSRRAQLTASFNRGYRSFASIYTSCTDSAAAALERYRAEGEALSRETASRFGN
jgi:uncharacterized protein (TIGR02301 family)